MKLYKLINMFVVQRSKTNSYYLCIFEDPIRPCVGRVMVIVTMIMNARDPWFVERTTVTSKIQNQQK